MKLIDFLKHVRIKAFPLASLCSIPNQLENYDIVISGHPGEIGSFFDEDNVTIDDKHKQIRIDI